MQAPAQLIGRRSPAAAGYSQSVRNAAFGEPLRVAAPPSQNPRRRVWEKWSGVPDWGVLRAGVPARESGNAHLQRMSEGLALLLEKKQAK
eukprot:1352071-Pleurochrysis_carterae.AAC.1